MTKACTHAVGLFLKLYVCYSQHYPYVGFTKYLKEGLIIPYYYLDTPLIVGGVRNTHPDPTI